MSLFDELVARYRNMNYGNLSGNNPSAVRSLLDEYNDRTYTQVLDPSQVTYLGDVPQNQWFYDDRNHLQFGMPGEGIQGGLVGDETTGTTGWPTYDPYTDYGDPGYAGVIPGEGEVGQGLIDEVIQRGGGRDRGLGDSNIGYERLGNSWYKINRLTGEVTKTDPRVPGLIGMAIAAMPDQNIANTLDRIGRQYGSEVRDRVTRGLIAHDDFRANPHTDVSFSSQPSALGYSLHSGQQYSGQDATTGGQDATTGGFDPSTDVGYDSDGDGIADRAVTYRDRETGEMKNVTWGEQDEAVGEQDADADPDGNGNGGGQNGGPGPGGPVGGPGHAGGHHF